MNGMGGDTIEKCPKVAWHQIWQQPLAVTVFSQPSIYIDGWLWHEDDVCRL